MEEENNEYGPQDWHNLGYWVDPVFTVPLWFDLQNKELDFDFITDAKGLRYNWLFLKKELEDIRKFVEDKMNNDQEWFDRLFEVCDQKIDLLLSHKDKENIERFVDASKQTLSTSFITILIDHVLEKYVDDLSKKTGVPVTDIHSQIKPYKKTHLIKYQEEIKDLNEGDIEEFVKKYEWVGTHMLMGEPLTAEKVREEMKNDFDTLPPKEIKLPEEVKHIVEIGSKLAYYRTFFVECFEIVAMKYRPIMEKLGEKYGLSWDDLMLFTSDEVIELEKTGRIPENFKKRAEGWGFIKQGGDNFLITGKGLDLEMEESLEKIDYSNITELRGIVANKSEEKIKGVVKIIKETKNIYDLKPGDILVASETTPDYVMGMKIAGAIITNLGGITTHAAIFSREFGIPCIIGTKIATEVLKDGDVVEVNTNLGIVKVLEKANE